MKKIIIIGVSPLVQRRANVFYVNELINKGFVLEHCNLSPCFYNINNRYDNVIEKSYTYTFNSISNFEEYLKNQDIQNTIFIVELQTKKELLPLFRMLKKYRCICVRINTNASDLSNIQIPLLQQIRYGFIDSQIIKNKISFIRKYILRFFDSNKTDYDIFSLYISSGNNRLIDIHINQFDWENAKQITNRVESIDYNYAVFCDEYFPYHPDLEISESYINPIAIQYYNKLNKFFSNLESLHNLKVVIAAHPKSNYKGNEFNGRKIIKFKTAQLVKYCQYVILHESMSISYAIIYNKPILLVSSPELNKVKNIFRQIVKYSYYFQLPIKNIVNENDILPKKVLPEIRRKYIYAYLTSEDVEDKHNIDILEELFQSL